MLSDFFFFFFGKVELIHDDFSPPNFIWHSYVPCTVLNALNEFHYVVSFLYVIFRYAYDVVNYH